MALDGLGDLGDKRGLGCLVEVFLHIRVGDAVAQDLVAALPESLRNVGAVLVDAEIHLGFDRDVEGVEQLEQAPDADPIAVIAPREDAVAVRLVRRRDGRALALAEAELLYVDGDIDGKTSPVRPVVDRAGGDVGIGITTVCANHDNLDPGRRRERSRWTHSCAAALPTGLKSCSPTP